MDDVCKKRRRCLFVGCNRLCLPPSTDIYKKSSRKIHGGDVLEVIFDNPSSSESVSAMCDSNGNEILEKIAEGGKFMFKIKKA